VLDSNPNFVIVVYQATQKTSSILILKLAPDQTAADCIQDGVVPTAKAKAEDLLIITSPLNNIVETHFKKDNFDST